MDIREKFVIEDNATQTLAKIASAATDTAKEFANAQDTVSQMAAPVTDTAGAFTGLGDAAGAAGEQAKSAGEQAQKSTKDTNEQIKKTQSAVDGLTSKVKSLATAWLSVQTVQKLVNLSDQMVSYSARIGSVVESFNELNGTMETTQELTDKVYASAMRSRGSYTDTLDLVSQLGTMAADAFSSTDELVLFAEQLNKQLSLSGASGQAASAAILQLEQGLASGVLRGDELNSVMEQAPAIAKTIAEYMGITTGELRNMGSEGKITADIVKNALFAAAEETNAEFENVPMTWAQVWTQATNMAVRAADPLLDAINWLANNLDIVGPIALTAAAAIGVMTVALNAEKIALFAHNAVAAVTAAANAILASSFALPLLAIIGLVGGLYIGVAAFNKFAGTSLSATGIIAGALYTLYAFAYNSVLVPLQNAFAAFVNFLANAFTDPITAIKVAFYDMASTVLGYIKNLASSIEGLLNMIPGVTVDMTSGLDKIISQFKADRQAAIDAGDYTQVLEPWEYKDLGESYAKGYDWGSNLSLSGLLGGTSGSDIDTASILAGLNTGTGNDDIVDALSDISSDTSKISKSVDMSDETVKMLVDIAERKYVNNVNLTSQTPVITINGQNTGNSKADAKVLADYLRDVVLERLASGATMTTANVF